MKKITSICLAILLIFGTSIISFAQDRYDVTITGNNKDIIIDRSDILKEIDNIADPAKRDLLTQYCFKPLYWEINSYPSKDSYAEMLNNVFTQEKKNIEKIKVLSNSTIDEIQIETDKLIDNAINKVINSNNRYISDEIFQYIKQEKPEYINLVKSKVLDDTMGLNAEISLDSKSSNSVRGIVTKYYNKSLELYGGIGVMLVGTCEVDWTYDSTTNRIQSLYPNTTFVYDGVGGALYAFTNWTRNQESLSSNKSRGYVQKARNIDSIGQGTSVPSIKMVWNLVFSPTASNSKKTLYEQVAKMNPNTTVNWGGGY